MSNQYYYLVSGLYDVVFDDEKQSVFIEPFLEFLKEEMKPEDWPYISLYLLTNDNRNLLQLLNDEEGFVTPANYSRDFLEEAIKNPSDLPP